VADGGFVAPAFLHSEFVAPTWGATPRCRGRNKGTWAASSSRKGRRWRRTRQARPSRWRGEHRHHAPSRFRGRPKSELTEGRRHQGHPIQPRRRVPVPPVPGRRGAERALFPEDTPPVHGHAQAAARRRHGDALPPHLRHRGDDARRVHLGDEPDVRPTAASSSCSVPGAFLTGRGGLAAALGSRPGAALGCRRGCPTPAATRATGIKVRSGAQDRASPNFMGPASFGLEVGIFCDLLYSVLPLSVISGLDFLGHALSRPQARRASPSAGTSPRRGWASRGRVCHEMPISTEHVQTNISAE
jgi:hypothetical protein